MKFGTRDPLTEPVNEPLEPAQSPPEGDAQSGEPEAQTHTITLDQALRGAIALQRKRQLPQAEALFHAILEVEPNSADALHFLGVLRHQQGRRDEAVELIRQAIAICPNYADAHNNLGNILRAMERYYEALESFERAVEHGPNLAEAHLNYASMLRRCSRLQEAAAQYRRAIELNPQIADAHLALGNALYIMGRIDEAAETFRNWLAIDPDNPVARHMAAACGGGLAGAPQRASDDFIRESFDAMADFFDGKMETLHYGAPDLVMGVVAAHFKPDRSCDVLDAGCGTGLCGMKLAPYARRLVGVDLSSAMVEKARGRGAYHDLVVAELTAFLQSAPPGSYDLIVSVDTLVYFGDLSDVLCGASRALREGGLLAFTVESLDGEPDGIQAAGYHLNPHGRYGHGEPYVRRVLEAAGLDVVEIGRDTLRMELGQPVRGLIVTAQKPMR
jgi:predicted TPR repeat methyltransferase